MQLFNSLTLIILAGNPLHCNCELRWFRRWLTDGASASSKLLYRQHVVCSSPETMNGLFFSCVFLIMLEL